MKFCYKKTGWVLALLLITSSFFALSAKAQDSNQTPAALELGDDFIFFAAGGSHVLTPGSGFTVGNIEGSDGETIRAARFDHGSFTFFESFGRANGIDIAQNQSQADSIYIKFKSDPTNLNGAPPRITLIDRADTTGHQFRLWYTLPPEVHDNQWHELAIPLPTITTQAAFDSASIGLNEDGSAREVGALSEQEARWQYWGSWSNSLNFHIQSPADTLWREFKFNDVQNIGIFWDQPDNSPFGPFFVEYFYIGNSSTDLSIATNPPAPFTDFNLDAGQDSLTISWTRRDDISAYNVYYSGSPITDLEADEVNYIATVTQDFIGDDLTIPVVSPHPLDESHTYYIAMAGTNNWGVPNEDVSSSVKTLEASGKQQAYIMRLSEEDETELLDNLENGVAAPAARMAEVIPFDLSAPEGFTSATFSGNDDLSGKVWMGFGTAEGAKTVYLYAEITDDKYGLKFADANGSFHGVTQYPKEPGADTWIPGISPTSEASNGFADANLQWNYFIMDQLKIHFGTYLLDNYVSGSTHVIPQRGEQPDYYLSLQPYKTEAGNEQLPVGVLTRLWMRAPNTTGSDEPYMSAYYSTQHPMTFAPVYENIVEEGVYKGWKVLVAIDSQDLLAVLDESNSPVDAEMQFPEEGEIGYWPVMFELRDYDPDDNMGGNFWEASDMEIFHPTKAAGFGVSINDPNYKSLPGVALGDAVITSVENDTQVPVSFNLEQNYPNPFNPNTSINFSIPQATEVRLEVFNMLGQRVATLVNGEAFNAGSHSINFNAAQLSTGVYIYRLQAGAYTMTRKMTLIK